VRPDPQHRAGDLVTVFLPHQAAHVALEAGGAVAEAQLDLREQALGVLSSGHELQQLDEVLLRDLELAARGGDAGALHEVGLVRRVERGLLGGEQLLLEAERPHAESDAGAEREAYDVDAGRDARGSSLGEVPQLAREPRSAADPRARAPPAPLDEPAVHHAHLRRSEAHRERAHAGGDRPRGARFFPKRGCTAIRRGASRSTSRGGGARRARATA
jgi:hypothetical protein